MKTKEQLSVDEIIERSERISEEHKELMKRAKEIREEAARVAALAEEQLKSL